MFKFLKSKKGFTLVELMIVVVIMAILVAVAVPIFSAITRNAEAKTCIGNQREVISAMGNYLMLETDYTINGSFYTKGGSDNPKWCDDDEFTEDLATRIDDIKALFKTIPVCPDSAANIVITVVPATSDEAKASVKTKCENGTYSGDHKVPGMPD